MLTLQPISIRDASAYVARWHRHHIPPRGGLFAVACVLEGAVEPCGVAIVGRPVARRLQDGATCEVVRVATDGTRNTCSFLLGACKRAAQALGYRRCITYTLETESGESLRAVGAIPSGIVKGAEWTSPSRPRTLKSKAQLLNKQRWTLFEAVA